MKILTVLACSIFATSALANTESPVTVRVYSTANTATITTSASMSGVRRFSVPVILFNILTGNKVLNSSEPRSGETTRVGEKISCSSKTHGSEQRRVTTTSCATSILGNGSVEAGDSMGSRQPTQVSPGTITSSSFMKYGRIIPDKVVVTVTGEAANTLRTFQKANKLEGEGGYRCSGTAKAASCKVVYNRNGETN